MSSVKEEVLTFLDKCEHLKASKFIMATEGIKDLLKCVSISSALYEMFKAVTSNFNYADACRACLITVSDSFYKRSYLRLPDDPVSRLAFIFCLLVEFDHENLNFTNFILQYFPEDGSCYASFHSFCDKVIVPLEELIREVFKDELEEKQVSPIAEATEANGRLNAIYAIIAGERDVILNSAMPEGDKRHGICLLDEIECSIREGRNHSLEAVLYGYDYYSRYHNNFSRFIELLATEL